MNLRKILGAYLISLRYKAGYTQHELASISGVTRGSISNYELGESLPPLDVFIRLIDTLGGSLSGFEEYLEREWAYADQSDHGDVVAGAGCAHGHRLGALVIQPGE